MGPENNIVDNLNVLRVELQFDIKVLHIYKEIVEYIFFENINFAMINDKRCGWVIEWGLNQLKNQKVYYVSVRESIK